MKTVWSKGLDDQGKKDIKVSFDKGAFLRERLSNILKEKSDDADKDGRSKEGYDCPNWAYKQADMQGYKRALSEILSLLD